VRCRTVSPGNCWISHRYAGVIIRYFGFDLIAYWNRRLASSCRSTEHLMRNSKPKSEMPAMKEKATKDRDKQARQKSIDKEKKGRAGGSGNRSN
jgi:hypothetical protein